MLRVMLASLILLTPFTHTWAASPVSGGVTFYRDGAQITFEATAARGSVEFSLPDGYAPGSLRVRPSGTTNILQVEHVSPRTASAHNQELEALSEQKHRLEDRLKALEVREQIFTSAARSQSGKSPRRTKANPDPLQSLRQGTDFAIAQLEAVYTMRRKTLLEVTRIDRRIAELKARPGTAGVGIVRVKVTPQTGHVSVRFVVSGTGWTPRYDLLLSNGSPTRLILYGQAPSGFLGYRHSFSAGSITESVPAGDTGRPGKLDEFLLTANAVRLEERERGPVVLSLNNTTPSYLPPGVISLFRNREYMGEVAFRGLSSGKSTPASSPLPVM